MVLSTVGWFIAGGILLIAGAELLVRGASRVALAAGLSPLVVGLTVVAFGTSAPELVVTVSSGLAGQADVAMGNVVGSNIFNVLFILGLSALITPLAVDRQLIRVDVVLMILVSIATLLLALDGRLGALDGLLLFGGIVGYTAVSIWQGRRAGAGMQAAMEEASVTQQPAEGPTPEKASGRTPLTWLVNLVLVGIGLLLLVVGAGWFVNAAVEAAEALGVGELVIGLTIVAAGTSLPEVATSVLAALRGKRDIAVGNVVGSNLFNLLAVLGLGSLVTPGGLSVSPGALTFDMPVMIAVAIAALPVFFTGHRISRWEGAVFLGYYGIYTTYLVLDATGHGAREALGTAMVWFVLPLTALTLAVATWRAYRGSSSTHPGVGP